MPRCNQLCVAVLSRRCRCSPIKSNKEVGSWPENHPSKTALVAGEKAPLATITAENGRPGRNASFPDQKLPSGSTAGVSNRTLWRTCWRIADALTACGSRLPRSAAEGGAIARSVERSARSTRAASLWRVSEVGRQAVVGRSSFERTAPPVRLCPPAHERRPSSPSKRC